MILRGNFPYGKVQDQKDITRMSMAIPKKYATPGLWLPVGKLLTVWCFWIKDIHRTDPYTECVEFKTRKDIPMKDISSSKIGSGRHMTVQECRVVIYEGSNIRVNTLLPTFDWVEKEVLCAFWNCRNAIFRNTIFVMRIYYSSVDFLNIFIYVLEKGFGVKIPLSARYESMMIPLSMESRPKCCWALMVSYAENLSWCSTCRYPEAWYKNLHPPTYCSEDDHPNEIRVRPFKKYSKWSTNTPYLLKVYEALWAPSVSVLLRGVDPFMGCMWAFAYSYI